MSARLHALLPGLGGSSRQQDAGEGLRALLWLLLSKPHGGCDVPCQVNETTRMQCGGRGCNYAHDRTVTAPIIDLQLLATTCWSVCVVTVPRRRLARGTCRVLHANRRQCRRRRRRRPLSSTSAAWWRSSCAWWRSSSAWWPSPSAWGVCTWDSLANCGGFAAALEEAERAAIT